MDIQHKILVLDDDPDWLNLVREILSHLPSKPDVRTVSSSQRALAMLDAEQFRLLLCDLRMPRIDGLQVLSIVRRRFPELRTMVLSALVDEEFRSRAYALGVDLFWLKEDVQRNGGMFLDCIESLLGRETDHGFRGIQSKSLMDIIQMECLSRSSTVLRITRGPLVGKLWIQDGELIDAEAEGARGEAAFYRILGWKGGTFENLAPEPTRERTIEKSVNALLLESAQNIDETSSIAETTEEAIHRKTIWKLSLLAGAGADFILTVPDEGAVEALGTQTVESLGEWTRRTSEIARKMSERLEAGPLLNVEAEHADRRLVIIPQEKKNFLVGWPSAANDQLLENSKKLAASWDS